MFSKIKPFIVTILIPFMLFITIFTWGYVTVNIENTKTFSSADKSTINIDNDKIKDNIDVDLKDIFSEDNCKIKFYPEGKNLYLLYEDKYYLNLEDDIIGRGVINLVDGINNTMAQINSYIEIIFEEYD